MATLVRNIPKLKPSRNLWLLSRNLSCVSFHNTIIRPSILPPPSYTFKRLQSTENAQKREVQESPQTDAPVSLQQKLKKAVAEYGSTVIVFHVGISLTSLGVCYLLVSSGFDAGQMLTHVGISGETAMKVATNAGTFAVAYAVHKVFAPVRIMMTLTATPFIVRYLRQIGFLKQPK